MSYLQEYERHAYVGFVQRVVEKKVKDHVKQVHGLSGIEIDVCYCESFSTRCMVYRAYVKGKRRDEDGELFDVRITLSCVMTCNGFTTVVELPDCDGEEGDD